VALLALALSAAGASANTFGSAPAAGYVPRVPISALARPMAAFDPSRLHFSQSVSMGTAFGGGTTGLSVTSLMYQFQAPITMRVSLGNAWGKDIAQGSSFFLEGVDLTFRPSANTFFQFSYQDRRSPLQYPSGYSPYYAPGWYR
jgi:hypothetical protein